MEKLKKEISAVGEKMDLEVLWGKGNNNYNSDKNFCG